MVKSQLLPPMQTSQQLPSEQQPLYVPNISLTTDSSDFSVISSPSPAGNVSNGSIASLQDLHFALNSAIPDMSLEQMHSSFQELLRENLQLKEDVMQSNIAMKEQFDLMVKLHMHVENIQKEQVEKHEKARTVIENLRAENKRLHQRCSVPFGSLTDESRVDELHLELANAKRKSDSLAEENERHSIIEHQLRDEMQMLKSDFATLKDSYSRLLEEKKELAAMNAELRTRAAARQQSPDEFYDASDGSGDVISNQGFLLVEPKLEGATGGGDDTNQEMTLVEEKTIKNLLAQLCAEQNKNKQLEQALDSEKLQSSSTRAQLEVQEGIVRRFLEDGRGSALMRLPAACHASPVMVEPADASIGAQSFLQKCKIHCDSMENLLGIYEDRFRSRGKHSDGAAAEQLHAEIATLRRALEVEQGRSGEESKRVQESEQRLDSSLVDSEKTEQNWGSYSREQQGRQSEAYFNLQEKFYQEKLDSVMAKLVVLEDKLAAKEEEVAAMQPELQKLKQEAETIPILQTQVELYKTDFHAEREAREKMHIEKERACEELRALMIRQKEVMDVIAELRSSGVHIPADGHARRHADRSLHHLRGSSGHHPSSSPVQTSERSTMTASPGRDRPQFDTEGSAPSSGGGAFAPPIQETPEYVCPKCGLTFMAYGPLENHVNACLDSSDSFGM